MSTLDCSFDASCSALAGDRARAERELVAAVLADPATLVPVAEAGGVTHHDFEQGDLRTIYLACDVSRDKPLLTVIRVARAALRADGWWEPENRANFGPTWSDESLCAFAESYPPSVPAVRRWARELLDIRRRQDEAGDLLSKAAEVLEGRAA